MKILKRVLSAEETNIPEMYFTSEDIWDLLSQIDELQGYDIQMLPASDNAVEFIVGSTKYQVTPGKKNRDYEKISVN